VPSPRAGAQLDPLDPLVWKVMAVAVLGSLMGQIDATVVNVSQSGLPQEGSKTPNSFRRPAVAIPVPTPSAQYQRVEAGVPDILRPQGKDSALRQWGLHLASRGGKQARNKAVVAVARKLAILLHRIWITQEPYVPFYAKAA